MTEFTPPKFQKKGFHCPYCGMFAHMAWRVLLWEKVGRPHADLGSEISAAECAGCSRCSYWWRDKRTKEQGILVHPVVNMGRLPHPDMPESVCADYEEARAIANSSSRAVAGLLRLALQKLVEEVGGQDKNLNTAIGQLVSQGQGDRI